MNSCAIKCLKYSKACSQISCRQWIRYREDLNCAQVAVKKNGSMTLKEVAKRLGVSYVRITQIEKSALSKLRKKVFSKEYTNYNSK